MCIGVPAKIVEVDGWNAVAEMGGASRPINVMLVEGVTPGDYVLLHAGYAISKVDEAEAAQILDLMEQMADAAD